MSGIIGGAGSKSGVIGETEIDYEEGVVLNALNVGGTNITSYSTSGGYTGLQYVKIGGTVHVQCYIDTYQATLADTGAITVDLPFAISAGGAGNDPKVTGMNMAYIYLENQSYACMINLEEDVSTLSFQYLATGGTYATLAGTPSVGDVGHRVLVRLGCSYQTDA